MPDPAGDEAATVAAMLAERPAAREGPQLLSIDGPAGSGKTTLAASVAAVVTSAGLTEAVLHMDDLYHGWSEELGEHLETRLIDQVLQPLSAARPARWQRYDWATGRFAEWTEIKLVDVLIIEGCGSGARAYSAYQSLLIWVEASQETRLARAVARDGAQVLANWLGWMASESAHFAREGTRRRADLAIRTG